MLRVPLLDLKAQYASIARRTNAMRYQRLFEEMKTPPDIRLPSDAPGHIYNQFVIRVAHRDSFRAHLKANGVETEVYYPIPLHLQECFRGLGYRDGDFPQAEAAARASLALPVYPEVTEEQQRYVLRLCAEAILDARRATSAPRLSEGLSGP